MRIIAHNIFFLGVVLMLSACKMQQNSSIDQIDQLMQSMTLEEKLGQLNQLSNPYLSTGTAAQLEQNQDYDDLIRNGKVGSFLNVIGAEETMRLQKIAVEESRLGIPLIFGFDVIHGFKTIFPIPLAEAASFDRGLMQKSARISAIEASANGLHWTFAPMMDVSRDPRWGRVMEGAGEDVYLNCEAAVARIKGFQGDDLAEMNTIAACAKHFAAYGAAYGGRDYHMADMSERLLREVYLPPFKAAVDAGVATFMSSFNTIGGVPASGDRWLQMEVLKNEWGFEGFIVSDWTSITEMIDHAIAENRKDAAFYGFNAGIDMDMMGSLYVDFGKQLISENKIDIAQIDDMVHRVLSVKKQLGLFDNPYQYHDRIKQDSLTLHPEHLMAARDVARKSMVLLQNDGQILPINKRIKTIALIGPLAADKDAPLGNWRANADPHSAVSLLEGIRKLAGDDVEIIYAEGCSLTTNYPHTFFTDVEINTTDRSGFADAIAAAKKADMVIMALGETAYMSGECRSYADISLKGLQLELLKEVYSVGKPLVLTLFTGRPLVLTDVVNYADAILNCWLLGSESGNAIADVLFGKYNPSAKLPASFPYHLGQIPVFYEQLPTGRPFNDNPNSFGTIYRDIPNEPLFPFGFGLSYTSFEYNNLILNKKNIGLNDTLSIRVTVTNTGDYDGEEVVQLYIRDLIGQGVSRPVLQLKGFEKVMIEKGKSKEVTFSLTSKDLAFFRLDKIMRPEAGQFKLFVGPASNNLLMEDAFSFTDL